MPKTLDAPEATPPVQRETAQWWKEHYNELKEQGGVAEDGLRLIYVAGANPDNIGYETGQIRPGELGQWDMFFLLQQGGWSTHEATRLSGLTGPEVRKMERETYLEDRGVNPDDPKEVAEFERLERMTPQQLDAEIQRLEQLLTQNERSD